MIELTCVACHNTLSVRDLAENLCNPHCPRCGQPLVEFRQPGSAPHIHPTA